MRRSIWLGLALVCVMTAVAQAATLTEGFFETPIASGIPLPTAMAFAPDGRLFVCAQSGALRVIKDGALLATPFVDLTVDSQFERGLLGVAIDPDFAVNGWVYVYYTATTPTTHNRISRFTAAGDVAQPDSEIVILDLDDLSTARNHNGGGIHFGPDSALYAGVGENGNGDNSQTLDSLLGKILRLNKDGTIPTNNPFYGQAVGRNRAIWAMGLRNPFTFAFQPGTGRMFINDVGAIEWEEIDEGIAGANYGWPTAEGNELCGIFQCPLYSYNHTHGCAITGGAFYNPATRRFPASYVGRYFFADYCGGWIRVFDPASGAATDFADDIPAPVDLQVGADGLLYYLKRDGEGGGAVYQIASIRDPLRPSIVSVDSITGSSAILHGSDSDTREASQWQVDLLGGDFSAPVVDSGPTTTALSSFKARGLAATTTYESRVRYRDNDGVWSPWSRPEFDPGDQFTTLVATAIPPVVVEVVPSHRSASVAVSVSPVLAFNVPVAAASVTSGTVRLVRRSAPTTIVAASLLLDDSEQVVTIVPAELLNPDSKYKVQVVGGRSGVESRDGAISGRDFSSVFFTETALAASSPAGGATGVPIDVVPQLDFTDVVDPATATTSTVRLMDATSGRRVPLASVISSGVIVTVAPAAPLRANHRHVLGISSGLTGLRFTDGRFLGAKIKVSFKTGS